MSLGDTIAKLRKSKGIKQKDMSTITGISLSVLSKIENDSRKPNLEHLEKIAKSFGMPKEILMFLNLDENDLPDKYKQDFSKVLGEFKSLVNSAFLSPFN
jgi:transcriptional regulator with XRE-family HTH domain